jgi:hypothetical protein
MSHKALRGLVRCLEGPMSASRLPIITERDDGSLAIELEHACASAGNFTAAAATSNLMR